MQSNSFAIGNNAEFDPATRVTVNISEEGRRLSSSRTSWKTLNWLMGYLRHL